MEPMTTGAVGIGSPISSSVAGLSSSAQTFTMPSVGPSSRAMIRPWKPGFSYRTQLKRHNHVILHFSQNKHQRFQRTVQSHHLDKLKCAATLQWSSLFRVKSKRSVFPLTMSTCDHHTEVWMHANAYHPLMTLTDMMGDSFMVVASSTSE